jgi:ribonuclease VapC
MVIDTSALVAILFREPGWDGISRAILQAGDRWMSTISRLEIAMVVENRKSYRGTAPERLIRRLRIETVPFDALQLEHALDAFRRYGKGRHPAALNLGDCCAYGLAKSLGEPLLFKGGDFSQTDIAAAVAQ